MVKRFDGKTAVITGGGTNGIGRATAARLVDEGAYVFITGRRESELNATVAEIGRNVAAVPGDITNQTDLDRLYSAVAERGQGLDVLFANAGVATFASIDDLTQEDFNHVFGVNVMGTVFTVQKAIPLLNPGASVIINASTSADRGAPNMGAYAASKAALRSFTRTWANELKDRGIRVNAISPGPTDTSGVTELVGVENIAAYNETLAAALPIGRTARVEEMAAAVAFLASSDSSFMLGANVLVDGGVNQI
ncbi:MAG: SDR family oxidoreductase [Microbacterium sp.]